ncbi:hypothetical protein GCM10009549_12130 [Streptomyces thermoalcalitolerans]|uniref:Uncharacterized protein n=1 Tax=Streptomyces thermoalcalitolerans TaxID=65605 RepID=A0ABN1NGD9_9ACTN
MRGAGADASVCGIRCPSPCDVAAVPCTGPGHLTVCVPVSSRAPPALRDAGATVRVASQVSTGSVPLFEALVCEGLGKGPA